MIGRNELILNEATMKEAIAYWLQSFMSAAPVAVDSIKATGDQNNTFKVVLHSPSGDANS